MALGPGTRLGPYEIVSAIGAGGMGEVYRARDTRLDRIVALKVLPDTLAADPEFRDRFEREARVISQLAHPHICTLFDVGRQDNTHYLVLEYLEGETLATRITRGALKPDDARRIATEIAEALDAAHRVGIVHRDLKPGNVMLTKGAGGSTTSPHAKLLDFGLAKRAVTAAGAGRLQSDLTSTPTMTSPLTSQGTILGTFQYMAPEQIEGREADARSDIWGFGCIVYEMLTGQKAFTAKTQAGLIGAILEQEPKALLDRCPSAPPRLGWVIALCLTKDPEERWQHVRDVMHELRRTTVDDQPKAGSSPTSRPRLWTAIAGLAAGAAIGAAIVAVSKGRERDRAPTRMVVLPAEGTEVTGGPAAPQAAISPDGTRIVFSAFDASRKTRLYIRPLDALEPRPIDGTEDGDLPFWSPDGRSVGFFSTDGKLKTIALDGGPAQTVCDVEGTDQPRGGGTWSRDGVILFSAGSGLPIRRVPATGGTPEPATSFELSRRVRAHMWPAFLPDSRRFLFLVTGDDPATRGIYIGSLGSKETTKLVDATVAAAFAPPNYVLFIRDGVVYAQPLDADASRLTGQPKPVAERIAYNPAGNLGRAAFTVSHTGVLVYRAGDVSGLALAQLTWVDRKGAVLSTVGSPGRRRSFDLSPDETRVAVSQYDSRSRQSDIWVLDGVGTGRTRVTSDPADEVEVIWARDGERLAFVSTRRGPVNIFMKAMSGGAPEQVLFESPLMTIPHSWSDDGRALIYAAADPKSSLDLWLVQMTGDRTPRSLVRTPADENYPQLSHDGRWLAYTSNESGMNEVYVQPFPPSGPQWPVSRNGGTEPRWRGDGKELYFISSSQKLMAAAVRTGTTFEAAVPVELFQMPGRNPGETNGYVVSRDGRFLVDRVVEQTGAAITVVLDWPQRLK